MAHGIQDNAMAYRNATPWHSLGTKLAEDVTLDEWSIAAKMNWKVGCEPIYRADGSLIQEARLSVRQDNGEILGVVGPRWTPLQNSESFWVFRPLVESGAITLETAGCLFGGKRIWILAKINIDNMQIVRGDEIATYILLSNGHDGKLAVHFGFTPIRVVCANTEAMARGDAASKLIRIMHHKNVSKNVESVRDIMNLAKQEFEATADAYRFLASKSINSADLRKYVKIVLNVHKLQDNELPTRTLNTVKEIENFADQGRGNSLPGVHGTWWAAYNGITEYLNYSKGRTVENRVDALWFGTAKSLSEKALNQAIALAS